VSCFCTRLRHGDTARTEKKGQLNALDKGEIDSTTYAWSIEEIDSSCILDDDFTKFSLLKGDIEFIGQCDFPKVMESQEPILSLKYSYKSLEFFLKPQFKSRLLK
jgi:hypothetical protein